MTFQLEIMGLDNYLIRWITFHCESCLGGAYNPAEVAAAVNDPKFEIQGKLQ